MPGPIKPQEVQDRKSANIPEEVFEVFNDLITKNWNGSYAIIQQKDVVAAIVDRMNIDKSDVYQLHLLDVEPAYIKAGWNVEYDKPGYNETYEPLFKFTKKA